MKQSNTYCKITVSCEPGSSLKAESILMV